MDEAELVPLVRAELEGLLGIGAAPRFAKVFRYPKASPQPLLGHADRMARIRARIDALPGLYVIGNAYDGVGIPDCVRLAEQTAARIRSARSSGGHSTPTTPPPTMRVELPRGNGT
jgi:oxygen-dependent protoporphyrinogen oxidase